MESKIKTVQDAYDYLKYVKHENPNTDWIPEKNKAYMINHNDLIIIAEAINTEYGLAKGLGKAWEPDYANPNQGKYFVYFEVKVDKSTGSGFAFANANYYAWRTTATVAARLYFLNSELAIYFGNQFKKLHLIDKLMNPNQDHSPETEKMRKALQQIIDQCDKSTSIAQIAEEALKKW